MASRLVVLMVGFIAAPVHLPADTFREEIRPVLATYCQACHAPESENRLRFLSAEEASDVAANPGVWRNVAMQLRNRTMPPTGPEPSEMERMRVAAWIDQTLRATACNLGEYAAPVAPRRLNRTEYENTVRDLFGRRIEIAESFPVDGSGGEGFDNNAETLFFSPLLTERYLEVTDLVLDQVIVTPPLGRALIASDLLPDREADEHESVEMRPGDSVSHDLSFYEDGEYEIHAWIRSPPVDENPVADILVDGTSVTRLRFGWSAAQAAQSRTSVTLNSGVHTVTFSVRGDSPSLRLVSLDINQMRDEPEPSILAAHFRLFGSEPGQTVLVPRRAARRLLTSFMEKAYRRPLQAQEESRFLALFDKAVERGDPYEAAVRLAMKAVMVSADFLFRLESIPEAEGSQPLTDHELATRLSYFLWGSSPDARLRYLADAGQLRRDQVLTGEMDRLLDDPRSRYFTRTFIGQWLGTKDVGGRVAPTLNEIQHFYTPRIAADMREEPVLLFQRMLDEDRSVLEFVDADYTFLTERLARHYSMPSAVKGNEFRLVATPDGRRGGLLGMGAVQAMNASYRRTSPVLRGVWTLETLLGVRLPAPPPDIPELDSEERKERNLTVREMLNEHRQDPACAVCHDVIDPIGFGFENYDWLGRWREVDEHGKPVDASGVLPSGEAFEGLAGLRSVLLDRKSELVRHVARKLLGYALGRMITDRDHCVIESMVNRIEASGFGARSLVREIVLSTPFRYSSIREDDS